MYFKNIVASALKRYIRRSYIWFLFFIFLTPKIEKKTLFLGLILRFSNLNVLLKGLLMQDWVFRLGLIYISISFLGAIYCLKVEYLKFMRISFGILFPKKNYDPYSILFSIFVFAGYLITDRSFFTLSIYYCEGPSDQGNKKGGGKLPHLILVGIERKLDPLYDFLLLLPFRFVDLPKFLLYTYTIGKNWKWTKVCLCYKSFELSDHFRLTAFSPLLAATSE